LLLALGVLGGQSQNSPTALNTEELRSRLDALESEIAAEREALSDLNQDYEAEREGLRQKRAELAQQLLDARLKLKSKADEEASLKAEVNRLKPRAEQWESARGAIASAGAAAAERLKIVLSETPGSEAVTEELGKLGRALEAARGDVQTQSEAEGGLEALKALADHLDAAHTRGTRLSVRVAKIYTATGREEPVRLLSIGLARSAYLTESDGRVGVALASPSRASGYRWSERLSLEQAELVRAAIDQVEARQEGLVTVPLDPTGRVQPETLAAEPNLTQRLAEGGPIMIPLGVVALAGLLLILERLTVLYGFNRAGDAAARRVLEACRSGRFDEAVERGQRSGGAVGRVLQACLARRAGGQRAMEDSIQEQLLQETPRLHRFMNALAILAAVAPLMGLLGTVTGIIQTFGVIRAFGNANPSLMAGGISEALVTTATGLSIAIPILIVHGLLRGRADRVLADAERHAATTLATLVHDQPHSGQASADQPQAERDQEPQPQPQPSDPPKARPGHGGEPAPDAQPNGDAKTEPDGNSQPEPASSSLTETSNAPGGRGDG
jgi:biopolymer transport protein ExbB